VVVLAALTQAAKIAMVAMLTVSVANFFVPCFFIFFP
jgi:hypothetical protein